MRIPEFEGNTLVAGVPVLVVVGQPPSRILEPSRRFHRMGIVVTENPFSAGMMQGERIANSMRNFSARSHPPRLDLYPVAIALIKNLVVQIQKG